MASSEERGCGLCGSIKAPSGGSLMVCSNCKAEKYCCRDHQREHWKVHKKKCAKKISVPSSQKISAPDVPKKCTSMLEIPDYKYLAGLSSGVEVDFEESSGRYLRTQVDRKPGDTLIQAEPFASAVDDLKAGTICDRCFIPFSKREAKPVSCGSCSYIWWCSETCKSRSIGSHELECSAWNQFGQIAKKRPNGILECRALRMLLRILFKKATDPAAYEAMKLIGENEKADVAVLAHRRQVCGKALQFLRPDWRPPLEEAVQLMGKVHTNSHGIMSCDGSRVATVIGLELALINHSCDPNCIIVSVDGSIMLKAVRSIPSGESLTISYVDVLQTHQIRHNQLKLSHNFECKCGRCVGFGRKTHPLDLMLDGYSCPNSKCTNAEVIPDCAKCSECGHDSRQYLEDTSTSLRNSFSIAESTSREGTDSQAISAFRDVLAACENKSHPGHLIRNRSLEALSRLYRKADDVVKAVEVLGSYIMNHLMPAAQLSPCVGEIVAQHSAVFSEMALMLKMRGNPAADLAIEKARILCKFSTEQRKLWYPEDHWISKEVLKMHEKLSG